MLNRLRYHQWKWPAIRHEAKAMLRLLGCVLFVGFVWALTIWLFMAGRIA